MTKNLLLLAVRIPASEDKAASVVSSPKASCPDFRSRLIHDKLALLNKTNDKIYGHGGPNLIWHVLSLIAFAHSLHLRLGTARNPRSSWNCGNGSRIPVPGIVDCANGRRLTMPEEHLVLPTSQSEEAIALYKTDHELYCFSCYFHVTV